MAMTGHSRQSTSALTPGDRARDRMQERSVGAAFRVRLVMAGLAISAWSCGKDQTQVAQGGAGGDSAVPDASAGASDAGSARAPQELLILHSNDMHSHLMGYAPERDYTPATTGDDATLGGMARLSTAISRARAGAAITGTPVLLLDAGDFMMGTLFELLATQEVPELTLLQAMGYDATTLGNHELDWTPSGLALILEAAAAKQLSVPILSSNLQFSSASADTGDDALEAVVKSTGALRPKLVKTVGGLRVGLFGLLGANAVQVTPQASPLRFEPIDVAAARMVSELRDVDRVDLVIALSHSGIDHEGNGEDAVLAAAVPGIDVIISGHTHDTLSEPVRIGDTLIVTAGSYTSHLGELALTVTPAANPGERASVSVNGYSLLDIDDTVRGDIETQTQVEQYITALDLTALSPQGLGYRQLVATSGVDVPFPLSGEAPIGNLVTDAYRNIVSALQPTDPPAIAVEANGQLRAPILKGSTGQLWFSDLFRVLPIGIGPNRVPGYPLVSFYLNARDLRSGLELGGAPELAGSDVFLQLSGLKVTYDMGQPPLQRVSSLALVTPSGEQALDLTDTTTCYQLVSTNYVAGLLGLVSSVTGGLLSVNAKDADCITLVDPTTRYVDADPAAAGVQELKHWQALYGWVSRFPDTDADAIPNVPDAYGAPQGRIVSSQ
ncbi:MAG TPA: bifunctional UDP-sugar hydrolase/5'-nucleotidase [Polyangiaceae bacterium]|nr:bifunctional UDP-sugar hydrolase/5'-nucleotidase [Polyangiaceae bacterium]